MYFYILFSALLLISMSWAVQAYTLSSHQIKFTRNISMYSLIMNAVAAFLLFIVGLMNGFTLHTLAFFIYMLSVVYIIHCKHTNELQLSN
jgi:uncharacterized protein with PQ loop repeat